jgi:hypothetical protein
VNFSETSSDLYKKNKWTPKQTATTYELIFCVLMGMLIFPDWMDMNFRPKNFTTVVYLKKIIVTGRSELVQNQKWYLVSWTNWTSILSYSQTRMNTSINTYMYLIFWFRDVTHVGCRDGRGDECAGCTVACWYYVCNCSHLNGFPSSNLTHAALLHGLEKVNRTAICK